MFLAKKNNVEIILDLAHIDEKKWSGGKYRSTQTFEIFEDEKYQLKKIEEPAKPNRIKMFVWSIMGAIKFGIYKPFCLDSLRNTGHIYFKISTLAKVFPQVQMYIIEGTGFGSLQAVTVLKYYNKKVILLPINVESLAPYPGAWTHSLPTVDRLGIEAKYYTQADFVFCISLEETWLLNILGANAFFLPYFPPRELYHKILLRKEQRKDSEKHGLLYFANFDNSPNYLGFKKFVEEGLYKGLEIKVAGLGINRIKSLVEGKNEFIILGELDEEELEYQLIHCERVILNHFPTSGTVTRVPELLLSGIPIQGNMAALKSYAMIPSFQHELADFLLNQSINASKKMIAFL